ncbi:hypothetical protein [Methylotuvimicrobium buryatense]|uniref:hypothetical protein n=1 Tax=Methylotuvimicrobium buryatense TaxID=95641 RepID=UPI001586A055|nr:hypothetical protein [Methylotuvimicrobium buryatense]
MNADFAGAKICPAPDTCQSSNQNLRPNPKQAKSSNEQQQNGDDTENHREP